MLSIYARLIFCWFDYCLILFGRALCPGLRALVIMLKDLDIFLGAVAAIGLAIYLFYALLRPENF
jgi:K+-transporting ATPase KdpF subunit